MTIDCLRTLFITRHRPYPPVGGSPLRSWQNINIMRKYGAVGGFSIVKRTPSYPPIPGVEFWHYCNADRSLSLREKWERQLWPLRLDGHPDIDEWFYRAIAQELEEVITQFNPNLVIFEELWVYGYLKIVKRHNCHIIFDAHNVEAELAQQNYGSTTFLLPKLKFIERNFIKQVDQVWVCSEEDAKLLAQLYNEQTNVYVIPNGVNIDYYEVARSKQCPLPNNLNETLHTLLFLGQYNYLPNRIAAELLLEKIYPKLKQDYPNCYLLLVGSHPSETMIKAASENPKILVTGRVPDVLSYLSAASLMVVPLQQGGGTRLKILEAFAGGCPVISTSKGAEGIIGQNGKHLIIRDNFEEIVEAVKQLWSDPTIGENLANAAYELVQQEYSWEAVGTRIELALKKLLQ